ncbi:MAG TPA: geranylgeranyl reductase family protein [Acidimicrobiales bacterium]|jgi:geranylgeranyl reductase family protein|nr:geranylgeranyl reductase family protein [Acidimicrobiales bacterium]
MATGPGPRYDVLVIGAGPGGSSCAYWLAQAGWDVCVVERKRFPREKTCGDGLTPRAVRQLQDMGLGPALEHHHRYEGLRAVAGGRTLELSWPHHPDYPPYGYVVTRADLDALVAERAAGAGATVLQGVEASAPLLDDGAVTGAALRPTGRNGDAPEEVRARYVVVADGANSRVGRALGVARERRWPMGLAIRGYYRSPGSEEPWIESHLDVRADGSVLPGYGWVFPLGDGRVNVGVGLLSTSARWKHVNTTRLMEAFVAGAPERWGLSEATSCGPPTGGKLPMGLAVRPHVGRTHLVVGDAGGSINPFNGEGIAYAYETGRMGAFAIGRALAADDPSALGDYERRLEEAYGLYYRMARAFVRLIGHPRLLATLVGTGMHNATLMEWVLRVMANLLRPDELGPAEAAYRAVAAVASLAPGG